MAKGDWADRIKKAPNNAAKVQLHDDRFEVWNAFIDKFAKKHKWTIKKEDRSKAGASAFEKLVVAKKHTFAKKTLFKGKTPEVVFDASFGSMDATSDLDIGVVSTKGDVVDDWIDFVKERHKGIKTKSLTFTEKWDSNFYFEPGVIKSGKLVSKLQANLQQILPTKKSMVKDMLLIEKYADAYEAKGALMLNGKKVYPNPESSKFTQQAELIQYAEQAKYGKICFKQFNSKSVAELSCCKTEALLCGGSLAICGVFGKAIQTQFINDKAGQPWRLVSAFEMLLNIRMHMHGKKIKTKYLERLDNVLRKGQNACIKKTRTSITGDITKTKKNKLATLQNVLNMINVVVEDEIDGKACPNPKNTKRTFPQDIQLMKGLIRKEAVAPAAAATKGKKAKFVVYCKENYVF